MDKDIDFDTYLFISPKKLIISVHKKKQFEKIYQNEIQIQNQTNQLLYDEIDNFLNNNIFSIEKILKNFIKDINLIIKIDNFFPIQLSLKKNNYGEMISKEILKYLLMEAKYHCKKTIQGKKIIHMVIDNYLIDNNPYSYFPLKTKCNSISLDISLICLSENLIQNLEQIFMKYQISLNTTLSVEYLEKFFHDKNFDIFMMAEKIISGFNKNEVKIVPKNITKKGIFERFFHLFG